MYVIFASSFTVVAVVMVAIHSLENSSDTEDVSQVLLDRFLTPYKPNCRYLKQAQFHYLDSKVNAMSNSKLERNWVFKGDFAIPESCYIDDTGHFNSVEFNICYNQLFYIMMAYLIERQMLVAMSDWDLDTFKCRQLSDFLITNFSSKFRQPINSDRFKGELSIDRCSARRELILLKTSCAFLDQNGRAEGEVTIAVLNKQLER
ncbi:MAG: FcoT family thioesterase [Pseudanabaena sp. ELA607]